MLVLGSPTMPRHEAGAVGRTTELTYSMLSAFPGLQHLSLQSPKALQKQ